MTVSSLMFQSLKKNCNSSISDNHGFSLIEILIVMFILGVLLSMAVYSWNRFVQNSNLRSAARLVTADIAQYRERAIAESQTYTITFDTNNNNYTITPGNVTKALSISGPGIIFQSVSFSGNQIVIQTRGLLDVGNLVLKNGRQSTATITVTQSGRTYVAFQMQ